MFKCPEPKKVVLENAGMTMASQPNVRTSEPILTKFAKKLTFTLSQQMFSRSLICAHPQFGQICF